MRKQQVHAMAMNFKRRLPIPMEIREEMPLGPELMEKKKDFDAEVARIFAGKDSRKVLIIGPCSADREDSVLEYATRLGNLAEEVKDKLIIIPRVYTNKPRTKGTGYKGLLHNPDPESPDDLLAGVKAIRHMHLRVIQETGMFTADEMLYPSNYQYLVDLLSYVAVGARSVENQEHRLVASGIPVPVGMKNPTAGSTSVMLNSIYAAQAHQSFIFRNWEVECDGNPLAHAVLRGYIGLDGRTYPNYHYEHLERLAERYTSEKYANPAVVVDCNHDNSSKRPLEQIRICKEVLDSCRRNEAVAGLVKGFMIESYLEDGNQAVDGAVFGKSITDPCLGWEKTEALIRELAERL
ncbi:3-deoxy-7-phosphoheptulonate synthase [Collinsella acetigenes]